MEINNKNVNVTNLNTVQIQVDPAQANAGKKKKKMSKGKKIALISSLSAATAAVIIIPPVCVSQCNTAWNDYFERPTVEQMEKKAQFFNEAVTYTLELKQSVPLEDELEVRVESTRKSDDTSISVVENSVKYDKKTLTFQVVLDAKSKTMTKNAGEDIQTKKFFSNFNVIVSQVKISPEEEKQVTWTTTMSGFKINIDIDIPLNKTVSVDKVQRDYSIAGTGEGKDVLFEGFTTNTNPSCLKAEVLPNEGYHPTCCYEPIIEPVDLHNFNIRLKITKIQRTTGEDIRFVFKFTDKTDADWVYQTVEDHDFSLKVVYDFYIENQDHGKIYEFKVDEVQYDDQAIGPFETNLKFSSLKASIKYAQQYDNPPILSLASEPFEGSAGQFYVRVMVRKPDTKTIEPKPYDVVLTIWDGSREGSREGISFDFNIKITVAFDQFMDRDGYIEVNEGNVLTKYWFTSFITSNICLNDSEEKLPIIPDQKPNGDKIEFDRETFNYQIHFNPKKRIIPDNFLKYCSSYNQPIEFQETITEIKGGFLYGCTKFNQLINLPKTLRVIGEDFMNDCSSFNNGSTDAQQNDLIIPDNVIVIGDNFLKAAKDADGKIHTSFEQKIIFQTETPVLTTIDDNFLEDQILFNHELKLPSSVKTIYPGFLQGCISFDQPFTLPSSLTWNTIQGEVIPGIGDKFMFNCDSMHSQINVQNLSDKILPDIITKVSDNRGILSSENPKSDLVTKGVTFEGENKQSFANKLKDLQGEQYDDGDETRIVYRKNIAAPSFVTEPDPSDKIYIGDAEGKSTFEYDVTGFKTNVLYGKLRVEFKEFHTDGEIKKDDIIITINRKEGEQAFDCHFFIPQISDLDDGITFTYSLRFIDENGAEVKTITGFETTINFDLWQGREALIVDNSGAKPVYHWATGLVGSNICLGSARAIENNLPIITDDEEVYPRDEFNFPIWLNPKITTIPANFLRGCSKFNQPVYLSKPLQTISPYFLYGCTNFNQEIKLPSTLKTLHTEGFMCETQNMIKTVDFGSLDSSVIDTGLIPFSYSTFSTTNSQAPCVLQGINITADDNDNLEQIAEYFKDLNGYQPGQFLPKYWRKVNVVKH